MNMGRPRKKSMYVEAKARRKGELQAELEFHRRKPLEQSMKEHIGKLIDNFRLDPLEIAAVGGMTFVIHEFIMKTPELTRKILTGTEFPFWDVGLIWFNAFGIINPPEVKTGAQKVLNENAFLIWIVSLALAYIIVHNAGQLIGLLEGGITKIVPFLLGV